MGQLWFFHHIPKTAGSSLVQELVFCARPYFNIHATFHQNGEVGESLEDSYQEFLHMHKQIVYRSASGHLRFEQAARLREAVPHVRMFTFVRDPVERVISDYRYTRSESHPGNQLYRDKYQTLSEYVADPANQNRMWKFLAGPATAWSPEAAQEVLRTYTFIGVVEEFELCVEFLTALWGCPKQPTAAQNRTVSEEAVSLTNDLKREIAVHNVADRSLYRIAERRIKDNAQAMRDFIKERRSAYLSPETTGAQE